MPGLAQKVSPAYPGPYRGKGLGSQTRVRLPQHGTDGKRIGAYRFACAAVQAVVDVFGHRLIALPAPSGQAIAGEITIQDKGHGDIDPGWTGLAVIALAAEPVA